MSKTFAPFKNVSYRAQVARLRLLAIEALKRYSLDVAEIDFIHHGENATFKVRARTPDHRGPLRSSVSVGTSLSTFLLRIHRAGYHTRLAIEEELSWLARLTTTASTKHLGFQKPVLSRAGNLIEVVGHELLDEPRFCDLLSWVDGRFVYKNVRPVHMERVGQTLALLQASSRRRKVKHRRYWTAEGLVGSEAKMGSVAQIVGITRREQSVLSGAAKDLLIEFRRFARKYPQRMGLIHADLHFGNAVFNDDGHLVPIDFDDCGFGYHMYDLAVPLVNIEGLLQNKLRKSPRQLEMKFNEYKDGLLKGYTSLAAFDADDEEVLRLLTIGRRITMVGWLNSRADNPRLAKYLKDSVARTLKAIATL